MASLATILRAGGLPLLEARILAAHALQVPRVWTHAHENDDIDAQQQAAIELLFARRRKGEPVAYLTGEREFYGLSLQVTPAVLIPRPETELLVELALERLGEIPSEHPCVLDLGTGSGAIAIAIASVLAANRPGATVSACDASEAALAVARANAARHGVPVRLLCSDWFAALGDERFDVVVANPPYIAGQDPHLEQGDLRFEPRSALVADEGGLGCLRAIAETARAHLQTGGWLLMEHGYDQGEPCVQLLERLGYAQVSDRRDLSGNPRVVQGRFDPAAARR